MPPRRTTVPSWLISAVLHALVLVLLGVTLRIAPPKGIASARTAEVGIVLKHSDGDEEYYEGEEETGGADAAVATAAEAATSIEQLVSDNPPLDVASALPAPLAIGPGSLEPGGVGQATGAERGPRGQGPGIGGEGRTRVFGIEAEGRKFAYVFDRSGSMGGSGRNALQAAKRELIASLQSLGKTHQFQIIFYNEQPWRFNPTGQPGRMFFATEQNKAQAARFVGSITADGATRHEDALLMAIGVQPDVIFFLTDADEPKLWPGQLAKIKRRAGDITIHAIEFGFGPQADANNFLVQLARQNSGQHAYVDVSKMLPPKR